VVLPIRKTVRKPWTYADTPIRSYSAEAESTLAIPYLSCEDRANANERAGSGLDLLQRLQRWLVGDRDVVAFADQVLQALEATLRLGVRRLHLLAQVPIRSPTVPSP